MVGVDLGGTNVRAGSFFADGSEAGQSWANPSRAEEGTEAVLGALSETILAAVRSSSTAPTAVGVAIPGHIDNEAGLVRWAPNFGRYVDGVFQYWQNQEIRGPLERLVGLPVVMDNDANMAALGEYRFGTGRAGAKCLVMLTLGTGIGGGVILSPQAVLGDARGPLVLVGGNKGGAELGHVVVNYQGMDCNAGEYGSLEGYCQRDAIVGRAVHRVRRGRSTRLTELSDGKLGDITPRTISQAADDGDEVAIEVLEEVGTMLGVGIGNYINIFAPDVVAVGGQIAKAGDWILGPAIKAARNVAIPTLFADARITIAEQIEDAGMLGAAALAMESLKWTKR